MYELSVDQGRWWEDQKRRQRRLTTKVRKAKIAAARVLLGQGSAYGHRQSGAGHNC